MKFNVYKVLIEDEILGDFNRLALLRKNVAGKTKRTSAWYMAMWEVTAEILSKSPRARAQLQMNLMCRRY